MASEATREIASTAKDAKNYLRRRRWEKKANADPIKDMDDPREAATTMMAALASYDGVMSEREETVILNAIQNNFNADEKLATELLAHGRWLAKEAGRSQQLFRQAAATDQSPSRPQGKTGPAFHAGKCRQCQWRSQRSGKSMQFYSSNGMLEV